MNGVKRGCINIVNVRTVFIYLSVASLIDTILSRIIYEQSLRLSYNERYNYKRVRCLDDCTRIACTNSTVR